MTSSPTRVSPTPSRRAERVASAAARIAVRIAAGLALAAAAQAHDDAHDAIPDAPGWRAGAAAAVVAAEADRPWPTPRWPGVLVLGRAPERIDGGLRLEHAVLGAAARLDAVFGAALAVGFHDREAAHLEAARLQAGVDLGGHRLLLGLGRDNVRMGAPLDRAGHLNAFNQPPLAKRAVLNDLWTDDGLTLTWQPAAAHGAAELQVGLWRGRAFPGGPHGRAVPTLRVQAGLGGITWHAFAARLEPQARGAAVVTLGAAGHSHSVPDCRASLRQVVCFDGRSEVGALGAQWAADDGRWSVDAALLARRERGALYATGGEAAYRARVSGAWADLGWQPGGGWRFVLRPERLVPSARVEGAGATLLARDAGLADAAPVSRLTLAASRTLREGLALWFEIGHERQRDLRASQASLRLVWQAPDLLSGGWR